MCPGLGIKETFQYISSVFQCVPISPIQASVFDNTNASATGGVIDDIRNTCYLMASVTSAPSDGKGH